MKITIAKDQIIAGLQAVQNVVSTRTTLPILSHHNQWRKALEDRLTVIHEWLSGMGSSPPLTRTRGP